MEKINEIIENYLKNDKDFGFSSLDSNLEHRVNSQDIKISDLKTRIEELESLIMPILVNLMNVKHDLIKWPYEKRQKEIKSQIEKILKLTRYE